MPDQPSASTFLATPTPLQKDFPCTWGNCIKSFSRAEHLHRHAVNHDESKGNNTCKRCAAVFKRKDLLDRHLVRHKEKDDEAGGEGLGRLQTRKRLWRDSTGAVVTKRRPEHGKNNRPGSSTKRTPSRVDSSVFLSNLESFNRDSTLLSPPGSSLGQISTGPDPIESGGGAQVSASIGHLWTPEDESYPLQSLDSYDFLCNASWGSQSQEAVGTDLLYNDIFAPDSASSFNMPFTTMGYYSWLFGKGDESDVHSASPIEGCMLTAQSSKPMDASLAGQTSNAYSSGWLQTPRGIGAFKTADQSLQAPKYRPQSAGFSSNSYPSDLLSEETSAARQMLAIAHSTPEQGLGSVTEMFPHDALSPRHFLTPTNSASSLDMQSVYGLRERSRKPLFISEVAREGVLKLIDRAHPKSRDGLEVSREHPLLALQVLQEFCDLFFSRFNVSYPLIHQATFDAAQVDPLLLTSILLLGATYASKESHLFAICIHDTMRTQILASDAFTTRPTLWMIQTILLVECFGKSRAGQLQHDMSHLFHGLLINLIRRSDCQSARCQSFKGVEVDLDRWWRAEIEAEQKRRLALLCFMWDTQHAVLFSQSLCMNAAELKLSLPWDDELWEAQSSEQWNYVRSRAVPSLSYLSVLKSYINPQSQRRTATLNAFSRVLVLHGLMSVAWDLDRRDQTSLGIVTDNQESWQSRISRSYDAWKYDFDAYSKEILLSLADNEAEKDLFQKFVTANVAIYHSAHIILHVEIIDLQIFAGASHIIGRPVLKADRDRSRQRIEEWARNDSIHAAKAASHAAHLLRDGIRRLKNWDAGDVFHYPWCLYLAALTCWTFQTCSNADPANGNEADDAVSNTDEDADWDAKAEMGALVSAMSRAKLEDLSKVASKYRKGDLPRIIAKQLSRIRWAVVQEGMIVLNGLDKKGGND